MKTGVYKTRQGIIVSKKSAGGKTVKHLYETRMGRMLLRILISKSFSNAERVILDSRLSSLVIDPFIKINDISLKGCVPKKYESFNDFFGRQIYHDARKRSFEENEVASPADGLITIRKISDSSKFRIKGKIYTVESLLRNPDLSKKFNDGYFVLVRLCVDNYHHYSYPVSGIKGRDRYLDGFLHTVNPRVLEYIKVYSENARSLSLINTSNGSCVAMMEVGAMGVGRIVNRVKGEAYVETGEEKGEFQFGGSSIVLLFQKDAFKPDKDILNNSKEGYETPVLMCEHIGNLI